MPRRTKGQHFLLTAAARSLSLAKVLGMTEPAAEAMFAAIRWAETLFVRGAPARPATTAAVQPVPHAGVARRAGLTSRKRASHPTLILAQAGFA
jgi:hypothetical protein